MKDITTTFSEDLLLTNETGRYLYHTYAKDMPIIDYHTHLIPEEILENKVFEDLGELWLAHDHYKWRAMRTFGIEERLITGDASYYDKFMAFAEIFPRLIGNPLYLWCVLELKRYFGIETPLGPETAEEIYKQTKAIIRDRGMTPIWCLEQSGVTMVSTTDDPTAPLTAHKALQEKKLTATKVLPAFRPDQAYSCEGAGFGAYISQLETATGMEIHCFSDVMAALEARLVYFKEVGTNISDNGVSRFDWRDATPEQIDEIFTRARAGEELSQEDIYRYKSAFLVEIGTCYHKHGFVMQMHAGGYTGNTKMLEQLGSAAGFGGVDDLTPVTGIGEVLNRLTQRGTLPKTILYPLNANQIESYAILAAGFCDSSAKAKVQLGAPWWFNDQTYGIKRQFHAVGNLYPVSLSVGMLTDSRSFTAYPRHEVYRRLLCDYFGQLVEQGEYYSGEAELGQIIQDICYNNAKEYFSL